MATIGSIDIILNSQDASTNKSNITVKGYCETTNGYWRGDWRSGTYTIKQGSTVLKSASFTKGAPKNTKTTLFEVSLDVTHDSNGNSGTITVTFNYDSGWCTGTQTKTLTKIDRKSTITASGGFLDLEQELTINKKATSFTHTITYKCGTASGTICTKKSDTSIKWTPPASLASQNTTGRSVLIDLTIETFNGSINLGKNVLTKAYVIPTDLAPTVTYTIEEVNARLAEIKYPMYVQNMSQLKVTIEATPAYGAEIVSYKTEIDGKTYTGSSFTTDILTSYDTFLIYIYVKDRRGNTSTTTLFPNIEQYAKPCVEYLKVKRCNADGTENMRGEYGKVTFDGICTRLGEGNYISFEVYYKKTTESEYTLWTTIAGNGEGYTEGLETIFPADSSSSYNVKVVACDMLCEVEFKTTLSTGFAIMHWLSTGLGFALGKIAEISGVFDIGFKTRFFGGLLLKTLENGTDADNLKTSNIYKVSADDELLNMPEDGVGGFLEVRGSDGETSVQQRFNVSDKTNPRIYERAFYDNSWGDWVLISGYDAIVEQGTSGIWTYRKWRSGICECWGRHAFTPDWSANGTLYYAVIHNIALPFPIKLDSYLVNVMYSNYTTWAHGREYSTDFESELSVTVMQYGNSSENETTLAFNIKGRWK